MRNPFRRRTRLPRVDWCHGDALGSVSVESGFEGAVVTVKCNECASDKWVVKHAECPKCGSDKFGTSCVRDGVNGYVVTFVCSTCAYGDIHRQMERL